MSKHNRAQINRRKAKGVIVDNHVYLSLHAYISKYCASSNQEINKFIIQSEGI